MSPKRKSTAAPAARPKQTQIEQLPLLKKPLEHLRQSLLASETELNTCGGGYLLMGGKAGWVRQACCSTVRHIAYCRAGSRADPDGGWGALRIIAVVTRVTLTAHVCR